VTPLQLAQAYSVLASGGIRRPVSLRRVDAPPPGERVLDGAVAGELVTMMEEVVGDEGTARRARVLGYRVAGKTGTAHKAEAGGYAEHKYVSSFVGFGPVSSPRFIVAVMLDEPSGAKYYGGDVSAPVFASVMGAALRMLSVPPDAPQTLNVQAPARPAATEARAPAAGGEG
jgi:cell division protein FtsI (penicillin-binding protein 3)